MADSRSARLVLARLDPNKYGDAMPNRLLPAMTPGSRPVVDMPEELYVPRVDVVLDEMGTPVPDRGITRPWPVNQLD